MRALAAPEIWVARGFRFGYQCGDWAFSANSSGLSVFTHGSSAHRHTNSLITEVSAASSVKHRLLLTVDSAAFFPSLNCSVSKRDKLALVVSCELRLEDGWGPYFQDR
jgi:hypothetical protein